MYKILYSQRAKWALDIYFDHFKLYYSNLYSDTGIFSEHLIQERYIEMADNLFEIINTHIVEKLSMEMVYGRKADADIGNKNTIITTIQNRTLIIDYSEDKENETRTITELRIFRE